MVTDPPFGGKTPFRILFGGETPFRILLEKRNPRRRDRISDRPRRRSGGHGDAPEVSQTFRCKESQMQCGRGPAERRGRGAAGGGHGAALTAHNERRAAYCDSLRLIAPRAAGTVQ